jgi:Toprim domain
MLIALKPTQETIDIVAALKGRWHGSYAMCVCPAHADRTPSLSVRQGERGILVHCFAGCRSEDVLCEIGRTKPILNSPPPSYRPEGIAPNVRRIWDQGTEIRGTLGEVYLRSRRLPVDLPDLRFHPRCPFGRKPKTTFQPAVLVAVRTGDKLSAIQRIRLTDDGTWHDGKFMLGKPGQGAWAPRFEGNVLAIAEGMEDAASYAQVRKIPCWAALGNERLAMIEVPEHVGTLYIAEDNDDPGRCAAMAAAEVQRLEGRQILRDAPPSQCRDWAEVQSNIR